MKSSGDGSVIAFGELLWDLLPTGRVLGGAPANFAYRLSRMGIPVSMVSRVGEDPLGAEALSTLGALGVDTRWIQLDSRNSTGTVDVIISPEGNARYTINPGVAYDFIETSDELLARAAQCSAFCFGTLIQRTEISRRTLYTLLECAHNATKILDVNLRKECWSRESVEASLRAADILKLNDDEVEVLSRELSLGTGAPDDFAPRVIDRFNLAACLITRGARGVYARSSDGATFDIPGITVTVVDTIGSGDAFTAGFVGELLKGSPLESCCRYGNELGAAVAATKGGMSPVPF